ncbi:hypothetical protein AVEN_58644-1, partial [Araneus ventricosus]
LANGVVAGNGILANGLVAGHGLAAPLAIGNGLLGAHYGLGVGRLGLGLAMDTFTVMNYTISLKKEIRIVLKLLSPVTEFSPMDSLPDTVLLHPLPLEMVFSVHIMGSVSAD